MLVRVSWSHGCVAPLVAVGLLLAACQPTVKVEAPDKPITINLNVKLDAEVRVKLEEKAEEDIQENPDIF
jgi:predicted component of type VI protein secretion system